MNDTSSNLYKAPDAELVESADAKLGGKFKRFSVWWVVLLSFVTLGLYGVYWLYTRSQVINEELHDEGISNAFIYSAMIIYILAATVGNFLNFAVGEDSPLTLLASLLSLIGTVMVIMWVFKIRGKMHQILGSDRGGELWFGPIKTFFFNVLYMQYKINKIIDNEK